MISLTLSKDSDIFLSGHLETETPISFAVIFGLYPLSLLFTWGNPCNTLDRYFHESKFWLKYPLGPYHAKWRWGNVLEALPVLPSFPTDWPLFTLSPTLTDAGSCKCA